VSIELPDWLRGTLLLGRDGAGNIIPILIDAAGQINVLLRGVDALGNVRTVRVDGVGQLYAILRGAGGNDVSVDAAGNLAAILKGIDGLGNLRTLLVDASGQAIMVPRGASGNYLDVDAFGYLTAVLKGIYGGVLHTISVDANGRIDAFLMDGADQWGQTLRIGNAELAARTSNLRTYDWRGSSLYSCDFGNGLPAAYILWSGLGGSVSLDPVYWRTAGYSLKLVGGSTLLGYADWWIRIGAPPSSRLGLQVEFAVDPDCLEFGIALTRDWGAFTRTGGLTLDMATNHLEYTDAAYTHTHFADKTLVAGPRIFHKMKLVFDFATCKYVRGLFDGTEYDMSGYTGYSVGAVGADDVSAQMWIISRGGMNDTAYVDNFTVTTNEP